MLTSAMLRGHNSRFTPSSGASPAQALPKARPISRPPAPNHSKTGSNLRRINTYAKCAANPCGMNTSKIIGLKVSCNQHLQKNGGWGGLIVTQLAVAPWRRRARRAAAPWRKRITQRRNLDGSGGFFRVGNEACITGGNYGKRDQRGTVT